MPEIIVPIKMLFEAANAFEKADVETAKIHAELQKKMQSLEISWSDSSKQRFSRYYRELDQQLEVSKEIMKTLAREMQAIAERYAEIEKRL
jgi:WXG100 family type VII secretion target